MKKLLLPSVAIAGALLPGLAFAAYNDVTLTSSASVTLDTGTLNVGGDSNVIETMTVTATELSFTLDAGSTLKVSSPTFKQLNYEGASAYVTSGVCEATESSVAFSSPTTNDVAITVAIKSANCPVGSSTTGGSSGGGGGGGGATVSTVAPITPVGIAQVANNTAAIAAIKAQLIVLIQELIAQLIVQLQAQIQAMQTGSSY